MRRWGTGDDFGGIAVYLMSSASRYHTGDTFVIDGGYSLFKCPSEKFGNQNKALTKKAFFFEKRKENQKTFAR